MLYLLDANVLITAHDEYYPISRIPQFWEWIIENAVHSRIKMPFEMIAEIKKGPTNKSVESEDDELVRWLREEDREKNLLFDGSADRALVNKVYREGYDLPRPTRDELRKIGEDPILIAYALAKRDFGIVTLESKQDKATDTMRRHKRSIPFVCRKFGIRCIDTFELIRELDFKIP